MTFLLDITGDDIARLDDTSLRELVGLLCEADFRRAGRSTVGITWGGNQDAADGGFDVFVDSDDAPPNNSFIRRRRTGFQVKKPSMPKSEIIREMKLGGILRPSIKDLIGASGSYVIVSSSGSVTKSALDDRKGAMKEAVEAEPGHENLHLDFLDRNRVATWVRSHPSLIVWVRNRVGRALVGWRPYDDWARSPGGLEEEYLIDERLRLYDGKRGAEGGLTPQAGIAQLREILSSPGASVRLAGLSGVGKTRLVQALFDERIGDKALNRSQAFYTDMSDGPSPDPRTFAEQLKLDGSRAILVIDNCSPDLHRRLTLVCSGSAVSLITVEYDIRDDLPEETSVFRLEPASNDLIYELVERRFPHITQTDARKVAEFSGGNARVAIALAGTVEAGQTLSGFRDEQLFERLFEQRHDRNPDLMRLAEVCSLVYSFEGTDVISEASELAVLTSMIGKEASDAYHAVRELQERGLVQARGVWRAVLSHAIANRLAARALSRIPREIVVSTFLQSSERLMKSFTRRLNFLHDCDCAVEIVDEWLREDGWIGKGLGNLNPFGMELFRNVAPVSPEKALEAIDRVANDLERADFASR